MKTQTRRGASEDLAGPYIIQRTWGKGKPATYATRTGGWATERGKAWKFDTRQQAQFVLRGRSGEIVPAEPDNSDGADRSQSHELVPVAPLGKMRPSERCLLGVLETKVQHGLESAKEARSALREIRDQRLYRDKFATFEEYMEKRWGYSARQGHRLVDWAVIESNLLTQGNVNGSDQLVTLPASESQARPLKRLKPEEQPAAWQEAVASAPSPGEVTARHVAAAVERRVPARNGQTRTDTNKQQWPTPNQWGIYDDAAAERETFTDKNTKVELKVLQVGESRWAFAVNCTWSIHGGGIHSLGHSFGLSSQNTVGTRERALQEAALSVAGQLFGLRKDCVGKERTLTQKIIDWTHRFSGAQKGSGPKEVDRVDAVDRVDKAPRKGSPGELIREAMACLGGLNEQLAKDAVMQGHVQRALSVLRPVLVKCAGMDNMLAERIDTQRKDPLVEAKFRAIDALVEATAAREFLSAELAWDQERYQADQAVDHLTCLRNLLSNDGMRKPKGKR